jgi:hypothetical protein
MTSIIIASGLYVEASGKDAGIGADRNVGGGIGNSSGRISEGAGEEVGL